MAFRQMGSTEGFSSEGGHVFSVIAWWMEHKVAGVPLGSVRPTPACSAFLLFPASGFLERHSGLL